MPAGDGSILINVDADDKEARKKLQQLQREIQKTAKALDASNSKRNAIAEQLSVAREEANKTASAIKELQAQKMENEAALSGRNGDIDADEFAARKQAQAEINYELQQQLKLAEKQAANIAKLEEKEKDVLAVIDQQTEQLAQQKEEAGEIEKELAKQEPRKKLSDYFKSEESDSDSDEGDESEGGGLGNILKSLLEFAAISNIFDYLKDVISEGIEEFAEMDTATQESINGIQSALQGMKASWGAAFAPILNIVAPIIQRLIGMLAQAANAIQSFFAILGGSRTYKKAIANNDALADSYGGAGGAAEEAQKELLGFDEINKLSDDSGGGGGGGGASDLAYEEAEVDGAVANIADKFKQLIDSLDFTPLEDAFSHLKESLSNFGEIVLNALGWVWDNILVPLATWTIEEAAPVTINLLATAFDFLNAVLEKVGPALDWLWQNILSPLAEFTGDAIILFLETFTDLLKDLTDLVSGNTSFTEFLDGLSPAETILLGIATAIVAVYTAIGIYNAVAAIAALVTGGLGAAVALLTSPITLIILAIAALIAIGVLLYQNWDIIKAKAIELKDNLVQKYTEIRDAVVQKFTEIKEMVLQKVALLKEGVMGVVNYFKERIDRWKEVLPDNGAGIAMAFILGIIDGIWDATLGPLFKALGEWAMGIIQKVKEFFGIASPSTVFADIGTQLINGLIQGVKDKWNALTRWFSDAWNRLKRWWQGLSLGSFDFKTPHLEVTWEEIPGNSILAQFLGFTQIPHLGISWYARGGIVDGATLIGAGEAGKEAIVPLERHTEWINMVADRLIDRITQSNALADFISGMPLPAIVTGQIVPPRALSGGGSVFSDGDIERLVSGIAAAFTAYESNGGEQTIKLYLDGRQIAETVTKHQRRAERGR